MAFYRVAPDGIVITVRLTPKGGRDAVEGPARLSDGSEVLRIRVGAPPADDAANMALVALLAGGLRVPKSTVTIVSGRHGRLKQVKVAGDSRSLSEGIEQWSSSR
jgi:uncharacterized protein